MSSDPGSGGRRITRPRPGHADLPGMLKYDTQDARDILERSSARETAARTVAGHLSKLLLAVVGTSIVSHVTEIGSVAKFAGLWAVLVGATIGGCSRPSCRRTW